MPTYTKQYYRLSEVSSMLNIPASTINYWVYTFDELDPPTSKGGHRRYRPQDVEMIKQIAAMMHDRKMQIEGAKKALRDSRAPWRDYRCKSAEDAIGYISELGEILRDNPKALSMLNAVKKWVGKSENSAKI